MITGSTGFVGANLTRRLIQDGHEVHCLVRHGYIPWRIDEIRKDIYIHEVDFDDVSALSSVCSNIHADWIFHLAVFGAYSWQTDVSEIIKTNILGTTNLVDACLKKGFEIFVNTGSSSEYGIKDHAPQEDEWADPNSYYAVSKVSATQFCRFTANRLKVNIPTLRLYSVYGPYEQPGRLMPTLITKALAKTLPPLVNPNTARDFIFIDDVLSAYLQLAQNSGKFSDHGAVFNVGTGVQTSLSELVDIVCNKFELKVEPDWGSMQNKEWDSEVWIADSQKIQSQFKWKYQISLTDGLQKFTDWYTNHPELHQRYLA